MIRTALAAVLLCSLSSLAWADTHEVKMLNRGPNGPMDYDPAYLVVKPGDTVKFLPTVKGHNVATIDGFIPEGAEPFLSKINQEFEVTLEEEGTYGVKCSPHFDMGMVMLIQVGERKAEEVKLPEKLPPSARKRFTKIIETAKQAGL
ncbi:pseudoazurin [Tianweitania sp. BSSL-BM11]|uniref:Pseudoazurin n=1 Tax=Tianweitania aestuarii TaxID=2814886 RepID=A0ABS5RRA5_9HYPH|nr:pseudoazurin [Tianweitania aestuarii]MBS9719586.1 pseudoazurin [Tianweitania aestuarii]